MSALTFDEFVAEVRSERRETPYIIDHIYPGEIKISEHAIDANRFSYIDGDGIKNICAAEKLSTLERRAYLRYLLATDNELLPNYTDKEVADMVRGVSHIFTVEDRSPNVVATTCANLLIGVARTMESTDTTIKLADVIYADEQIGDWEVTVRRID